MSENFNKKVEKLRPFTKFIYTIGELPSSYLFSMTYEEQLIWLCNYIAETVIPTVNNNAEATEELQNLYVELKNYVDEYFENLDVQEEINNKLDDMAEHGDFNQIIARYVDPIYEAYETEINNTVDLFQQEVGDDITAQNARINIFEQEITNDMLDQNNRITELDNAIKAVSTSSPIPVSSTSAMTNTSKLYLLTTNGYVYYYSGGEWVQGWLYQATQIGQNSVKYMMLEEGIQENMVTEDMTTGEYTNNGTVYVGDIGSTISSVEVTNGYSGMMSVSPDDTIIVPFVSQISFDPYALYFTNADNEVISRYSKNDINNVVINQGKIFKVIVPQGASKLYFNNVVTRNLVYYPYKTSKYSYIDTRMTQSLNEKEKINVDSTLNNTIYSLYSFNYSASNYKTEIYDVEPLEKIRIETIIPAADQFVPAIFFDDDNKPVGFYYQRGNSEEPTSTAFDTLVPANATKLYICTATSTTNSVYKYKISDKFKLNASFENGILTITNLFNGNYIKFKNFGGNDLFMIDTYKVGSTTINTGTDMIPSPYYVKAINNIDGDSDTRTFTGGNHQYNNQASGSTATAREVSLVVYADSTVLSDNTTKDCQEVTIIETNRVQGYNTKKANGSGREILEEQIVFKYDGDKLDVINTITPLEEILIERYYGIQTALFNNSDYKVYADKVYTSSTVSSLTRKPDMIFGGSIICAKLFNEGLGDYTYNTSSTKAYIGNQKSYYAPIYDNTTNFDTSDIVYIHGEYILDNNLI